MKAFVWYTLARLGLFVAAYALVSGVWLLVTGDDKLTLFWPLLIALLISSVASVYLLRGPRARFAQVIEERAHRATAALEASRSKEDVPD